MSQTFTQPDNTRITLSKSTEYRDSYANSVQVRLTIWDFLLVFGRLEQQSENEMVVENFQGIYLSPQQAKALQSILNHNIGQYEQTFGPISLAPQDPAEPRFVIPDPKGPVH